jgi:hypothetical protein
MATNTEMTPAREPGPGQVPVAQLGWKPLQPVPKGLTNMGPAFAGKAALRLAIAISRDAQSAALDRFIGDPGVPVLVADSTEDIADRLVAVSLAVSRMSEAGADRGAVARRLFGVPGDVPSKIFDQDTIV